jgi:uncharacterized cupredoxin-like copper-binding protein
MTHVRARRALIAVALAALAGAVALVVVLRSTSADAASTVNVRLSDFRVTPSPRSVAHGRVTFVVRNSASMEHELIVIKTGRRASDLPLSGGKANERGSKGEVEVEGGDRERLTLNLRAGHYVLICNVGQHYRAGMRANLTVR